MEKSRLLLLLIKRFPPLASKYGEKLIESLLAAESSEQGQTNISFLFLELVIEYVFFLSYRHLMLGCLLLQRMLEICLLSINS